MSRKKTAPLLAIFILAPLVVIIYKSSRQTELPSHASLPQTTGRVSETSLAPAVRSQQPVRAPEKPALSPKPLPSAPPQATPAAKPAQPPSTPAEPSSGLELHQELIPKDIVIVRLYFAHEFASPGATMDFDVDGSGFTPEFANTITIDPSASDITVKNLRLVTTNQIHGQLLIGFSAKTGFVFPKVLIKGLPVFITAKPLGVIQRGEVLMIQTLDLAEDGKSGRFRVVTNIDENMYRQFWVETTTPDLLISPLRPAFPFFVEGSAHITPTARGGGAGLIVSIFSREVFRREDMFGIVKPDLGETGLPTGLVPEERFHRPGDTLAVDLTGTGFRPENISLLTAHVEELDMGKSTIKYLSSTKIRLSFKIPTDTPPGSYSVRVDDFNQKILEEGKEVFVIVPPLWVAGVQPQPPAAQGQKGKLRIMGRDLTVDFAQGLKIESDEPGIHLSACSLLDSSTLEADISIDPSVAPGDYLLHLSEKGNPVQPQFGGLITVAPGH